MLVGLGYGEGPFGGGSGWNGKVEVILILPTRGSLWDVTVAFSHFTLEMSHWILLYTPTSGATFLAGSTSRQPGQLFP